MSLRIIFAGTAKFAVPSLQALIDAGHDVVAVYTQPDRPAGRGRHLHASPIKQLAETHQLTIHQPSTLKTPSAQHTIAELQADIMVVIAYGLIIPADILVLPRLGCINVHGSLLPQWRGAAPIQRAILAGDKTSGISIMQMDQGLDTGPVLMQQSCAIDFDMTSAALHDQLAPMGATALLAILEQLTTGQATAEPQDDTLATYAHKIIKADAELNWSENAIELHHQICAFNPWPVAFTYYQQQPLRIWQSQVPDTTLETMPTLKPGTIIACDPQGIDVASGKGILRICKLQRPGGKAISAGEFINAQQQHLIPGETRLGKITVQSAGEQHV